LRRATAPAIFKPLHGSGGREGNRQVGCRKASFSNLRDIPGITFSLPIPVVEIGGHAFALPGGVPTWALVFVSVVCIAIGLWQLLGDVGFL